MFDKTEQEIMKNWQGDVSKPVVSICSITYNHEKYIAEAIDSFLMQKTDFPFEIVIGEDCSTDDTIKIVEEYVEKYPNVIKLITSENNVGVNSNFERTLKACQGEFIAFCEGDDYWINPKKLQIQIAEMQKYPDIGLSFHIASSVDNLGIEVQPKLQKSNKIYSLEEIIIGDFHLVQTNTIVIKKEKIKEFNFDLLSKSPVCDVWMRVNASIPNGALFINKMMGTYRLLSHGSWSSSIQEENKFIKYINCMIKSIDSFDKYWEFKYTNEFLIYKNMFIKAVMKRNINQALKNDFISNNKFILSRKNFIQWNILYKYPKLVYYFKLLKKAIRGVMYVKANTK